MTDRLIKMTGPLQERVSRLAILGFVMALGAVVVAVLSALGARWELWHFRTGFTALRWAGATAIAGALVSLAGALVSRPGRPLRGFVLALSGAGTGIAVFSILVTWLVMAYRLPRIHDITTDIANPPRFETILALRKDASNPAEYGGPAVAAEQQRAYPDIKPLVLPLQPDKAFEAALAVARREGWEIAAAEPGAGRIEATDTTFWFGFKDDIVVRIAPQEGGSRVDVRSVSRVGISDVGTNARRIRDYLKRIAHGA